MGLPRIPAKTGIRQTQTLTFGGINRNPAAGDGTVFRTQNMSSDRMPLLSPRKPRYRVGIYSECNGITAYNGLYMVLGNTVYKDGEVIGALESSGAKRRFAQMNGQIIVFPDKAIIHAEQTQTAEPDRSQWPTEAVIAVNLDVIISNNAIYVPNADAIGFDWTETSLRVGNSVIIRDCTVPGNNKRAQITAIERTVLRFAANTFQPASDQRITVIKAVVETEPASGIIEPMNLSIEGVLVKFADGTYGGEPAEGNTIVADGDAASPSWTWAQTGLRAGDAVTITGSSAPGNNQTIIIREIEGRYLRFYENSFTPTDEERIFLTRAVPDMDGIFTHENRLWGWKGNTIYASKLGDPLNFEVFDGLSTDSWTLELDGPGDILGAIVYQGYPTFFKEERVYRVYGDRPSQYRLMEMSAMGVHPGCGESLAIAGDTLFYVSRNGMAAFNGGYSRDAHSPLGEIRFTKASACSDGRRYYLSAYDANAWILYVYDTVWDCWFMEDNMEITGFAVDRGNLYFINRTGYLWLDGHATTAPQGAVQEGWPGSIVEFNHFTGANYSNGRATGNPNRKGTGKLLLRAELAEESTLLVEIAFDGGTWERVALLEGKGKRSHYLPIIPRRSDHYRIKLTGAGDWTLHSLVREEYTGSPMH